MHFSRIQEAHDLANFRFNAAGRVELNDVTDMTEEIEDLAVLLRKINQLTEERVVNTFRVARDNRDKDER